MSTKGAVRIDPSNRDQLRAWDGGEGRYWAANADYYDRSVAHHHRALFAAAAIAAADRVLDIGCGTGQTTRDAARAASAGSAVGVDLSAEMLAVARLRTAAEGLPNATFEQADAQIHHFEPGAFDVAISRTGTMFFGDPYAAFANIARALRPGGRVALVTWRPITGNAWLREFAAALAAGRDMSGPPPDVPGPFALSRPERIRQVLGGAGLSDIQLDTSTADMWFGTDAADASRFVLGQLGWMLDGLDDSGRARAQASLLTTMAAHETDDGVLFDSDAWVITARKPD